ncbi:unnamed protein product, partial [Mycena citricolor]
MSSGTSKKKKDGASTVSKGKAASAGSDVNAGTEPKKSAKRGKKVAVKPIADDNEVEVEETKRTKGDSVPWGKNPSWIAKAIEYLTNNPEFRMKLFSDSTSDAAAQSRAKVQGKETKVGMYEIIMDFVAGVPSASEMEEEAKVKSESGSADHEAESNEEETGVLGPEWKAKYLADRGSLARSLQQQFSRMKKTYSGHVSKLYATGGGLRPEDDQANLIAQIKEQFVHWDELDGFWRELPNYNPIGVLNAKSGANHGKRAGALFGIDAADDILALGDVAHSPSWTTISRDASSPPCDKLIATSEGPDMDELEHEEVEDAPEEIMPKQEKGKKNSGKSESSKAKPKPKRFDIDSLDQAYHEDLAESSKRRADRVGLEIEREKNKRRKLENERQKFELEREERRLQMQQQAQQNQLMM